MSIQEVGEESSVDPEVLKLRECTMTGKWDDALLRYKTVRNEFKYMYLS